MVLRPSARWVSHGEDHTARRSSHEGGRVNYAAFLDRGPCFNEFTESEARTLFEDAGFSIEFAASESRLNELTGARVDGAAIGMYYVCARV